MTSRHSQVILDLEAERREDRAAIKKLMREVQKLEDHVRMLTGLIARAKNKILFRRERT